MSSRCTGRCSGISRWRPQDWVSFYGNYAESFGPNMGLIIPNTPVRPTNASSWEAGAKLEFLTE
ncbi:MAG: TonB-dependent receptor [Methylocella sp.]|jgi:iron complex outermembrane receptor protein